MLATSIMLLFFVSLTNYMKLYNVIHLHHKLLRGTETMMDASSWSTPLVASRSGVRRHAAVMFARLFVYFRI